eukprot:11780187-Karenia_brevis.AAC.1
MVGMTCDGLTHRLYPGQGRQSGRRYRSCPSMLGDNVTSLLQHTKGSESMHPLLKGHLSEHLIP